MLVYSFENMPVPLYLYTQKVVAIKNTTFTELHVYVLYPLDLYEHFEQLDISYGSYDFKL